MVITAGLHAGKVGYVTGLPGITDGRYRVGLADGSGAAVWVRPGHLERTA